MFNDAKRGTLSAWSFPSRHVAWQLGEQLDLTKEHNECSTLDLSYVTPHNHRDLLLIIAETDRKSSLARFEDVLTISLRVEGAVDKQRIDNKHVMAKMVLRNGDIKTEYLGFSESEERGSLGQHEALQSAVAKSGVPWSDMFGRTSSIVTDGESANTGSNFSLWTHLQEEWDNLGNQTVLLLKIWCAVHRPDCDASHF